MSGATSESEITASSTFVLASETSVQELGDEEGGVVLKLRSGELYTTNDTSLAFLRALNGKRTIAAVAERMIDQFDVEKSVLVADLVDLARQLADESLIKPVE